MNEEQYAVWWLSEEDCKQMNYTELLDSLPDYIAREFRSLLGRAGRGRLWVSANIPITLIEWDESQSLTKAAAWCGGIVIYREHAIKAAGLPGFVTDLDLKPIDFEVAPRLLALLNKMFVRLPKPNPGCECERCLEAIEIRNVLLDAELAGLLSPGERK